MILRSMYWYVILHLPARRMMQIVSKLSGQRALDVADAVLTVFRDDEPAMVVKLYALYGLDRFDDALAFSARALTQHPDNSALHGVRANVLLHFGQTDEALVEYNSVLALHPHQPAALMHKGNLLADKGHIDIALQCYEDVVQNDQSTPDDVFFAYVAKGSLLVAANRIADVEELCAELASQYDSAPSVLSMVGALYCQIGQVARARAYYEDALEHAISNSAMAARIRAIISEIVETDTPMASVPTENATDCRNGGTAQID